MANAPMQFEVLSKLKRFDQNKIFIGFHCELLDEQETG